MLPPEKELLDFIEKKANLVNFSMIAKHFNIKNTTVYDLIDLMEHKKLVIVKQIGSSKLVMVKKK